MIDQMEGLNIKDFVIEDPANESNSPFDAKVDISEKTWSRLNDAFERGAKR